MPIFGYATVNEWDYISDGARIESTNYIIISGNENQRLLAFEFPSRSMPEMPLPSPEVALPSLTPDTGSEDGELRTGSTSADSRAQVGQVDIRGKHKQKAKGKGKLRRAAAKKEGEEARQARSRERNWEFVQKSLNRQERVVQVVKQKQRGQAKQVDKSYQDRYYQEEGGGEYEDDGDFRLSKWCFLGGSSPAKRVIRWSGSPQRGYFPRSRLFFHSHPISRTFVFDWRDMGSQTEVYLCEAGGNVVKLARDDPMVEGVRFTTLGEPLINIMGFEKTKLVTLVAGSVQADVVIDSLMGMNNFWQEYRYMADLSQSATDSAGSVIGEGGEDNGAWREERSNHVYGDTYRDVITNNVPIGSSRSPQKPIDIARSRVEGEPRMNVENSQEARLNSANSEPPASIPIPIPIPKKSPCPGEYGTALSQNIDRSFFPNEEAIESYTPCSSYDDKYSSRPPASLYPCASRVASSVGYDPQGNPITNQFHTFINSVSYGDQPDHGFRQYHRPKTTQVVRDFILPPDNPASIPDKETQRRDFLTRVGRLENWNIYPPIQIAPEYLPEVLRPLDWTGRVGDKNGLPDVNLMGKYDYYDYYDFYDYYEYNDYNY